MFPRVVRIAASKEEDNYPDADNAAFAPHWGACREMCSSIAGLNGGAEENVDDHRRPELTQRSRIFAQLVAVGEDGPKVTGERYHCLPACPGLPFPLIP
jgi:hypothetical protein